MTRFDRRILFWSVALVVVILSLLAGCGNGDSEESSPQEQAVGMWVTDEKGVYEVFQDEYPERSFDFGSSLTQYDDSAQRTPSPI